MVFQKGQPPAKHKEGCICFRCNSNAPKIGKLNDYNDYTCKEYIKGRTEEDIAKELKVSIAAIGKRLNMNNIKSRPKGFQKGMKKFANGKDWGYQNKGVRPHNYIDGRSDFVKNTRYGDDWEAIRMVIYQRDKFQCQDCGITQQENGRNLDVHHKIPYLFSGDNSIENLVTLCRSCHLQREAKINEEYKSIKIEVF